MNLASKIWPFQDGQHLWPYLYLKKQCIFLTWCGSGEKNKKKVTWYWTAACVKSHHVFNTLNWKWGRKNKSKMQPCSSHFTFLGGSSRCQSFAWRLCRTPWQRPGLWGRVCAATGRGHRSAPSEWTTRTSLWPSVAQSASHTQHSLHGANSNTYTTMAFCPIRATYTT